MISPGAIVRCRFTGSVDWIVKCVGADGRWQLIRKAVDKRGRSTFIGHEAGAGDLLGVRRVAGSYKSGNVDAGDIETVTPAPTYAAGSTVRYHDLDHAVIEDRGCTVLIQVSADSIPLRGGGSVLIPSGRTLSLSKADLILEALEN